MGSDAEGFALLTIQGRKLMIDESRKNKKIAAKEKVRQRMQGRLDPDNYEYFPASITKTDYYDNETEQHVGIYVRVSTDDIRQTTSYELQKKYYEDFVTKHPNWKLVEIYADEGISGTSLAHRDSFNRMMSDAKAGRLTLIICKSVILKKIWLLDRPSTSPASF